LLIETDQSGHAESSITTQAIVGFWMVIMQCL